MPSIPPNYYEIRPSGATSGLAKIATDVAAILVDTGTTLDGILDRVAVLCVGNVTGAGTGTEVFVYGGMTWTR